MIKKILNSIVEEYRGIREEIGEIKRGYSYARELTMEVLTRSSIINKEESNQKNTSACLLQLVEYNFIKADFRYNPTPEGVGFFVYGATHRKKDRFMKGMLDHLLGQHL